MVDSLGTLFSRSFAFFREQFVPILIGAVVAGVIMFGTQTLLGRDLSRQAQNMMGGAGINQAQMQELQRRLEAGDPAAAQELQQALQNALVAGKVGGVIGGTARLIVVSLLVAMVLSVLYQGFILLLLLERRSLQETLPRLGQFFLPLLGLSLWLVVRSFVWIPIIGIVFAIVLGPRFALAPLILVKEKKGVFESTRESYLRTNGYWGKIFGNVLVVAIVVGIVGIVINMVLSTVLRGVAPYLAPIVNMLMTGFISVFVSLLSLSILAVPDRQTA